LGSQKVAEKLFTDVLGNTPSIAGRAIAMIDLAGGWDAFVERIKIDLFGMSKDSKDKK
jgi:filamentous hemagglutinin